MTSGRSAQRAIIALNPIVGRLGLRNGKSCGMLCFICLGGLLSLKSLREKMRIITALKRVRRYRSLKPLRLRLLLGALLSRRGERIGFHGCENGLGSLTLLLLLRILRNHRKTSLGCHGYKDSQKGRRLLLLALWSHRQKNLGSHGCENCLGSLRMVERRSIQALYEVKGLELSYLRLLRRGIFG